MILGEYSPESENHRRTETALADAAGTLGITLERNWVSTTDVSEETLVTSDALFVATGSPYRDFQKALEAIRIARERSIPCLGTCGGFQHMVVYWYNNETNV
jgi:CTP synthase (UTP-ammonia lyase)